MACAATINSMANTCLTLSDMSTTLRAETELIATKFSVLADIGTESTDAGWANTLFSETSEAVSILQNH